MKHLFTTFLLSLFPLAVAAQDTFDYMLFRPGVQYLYEKQDLNNPEYVGMKLSGNGEEAAYESLRGDDLSCRQRVPSFAGLRVRQQPAGTTLLFYTDSLHLRPAAQIGQSWTANERLLGRVDSVRVESFLGLTDSVRYLSFHDAVSSERVGISIRLSKLYGLLTATYFYDLESLEALPIVGLGNPEVGLQAPSFRSLTNFRPGDVYHTRLSDQFSNETGGFNLFTETQATVLEVDRISDSLVHILINKNELTYRDRSPYDSVYRENREELIVYDLREQPLLGGRASQLFTDEYGNDNIIQVYQGGCLGMNLILDLYNNSLDENCFQWDSGLYGYGSTYLNSVAGPFFHSVGGGDVTDLLLYYDNERCSGGTPLNFNGLVDGVRSFRPDERIRLYPNPATTVVRIELPLDLGPTSLRLYDVAGRQIRRISARSGNHLLAVDDLAAGSYLVVVWGAAGPLGRRRLVVR